MFSKMTSAEFVAPRRQERKVTGHNPSSRANARDLRKISPFGRNDIARTLRLCASNVFRIRFWILDCRTIQESTFLFERLEYLFRRDRQILDAHADGIEDRVVDDGGGRVHVELTQSFGAEGTGRFIGICKGILER